MLLENLIPVAFAFAVVQGISYYATTKVLGNELSKKSSLLISFGCLLSLWPTLYLGIFLQSILVWATSFVLLVGSITYYLRKLCNNNISLKQALLIYGKITLKLIAISISVGILIKIIFLIALAIGSNSQ